MPSIPGGDCRPLVQLRRSTADRLLETVSDFGRSVGTGTDKGQESKVANIFEHQAPCPLSDPLFRLFVVAKTINVTLEGETAVFAFKPIDRSDLYGKRRRIAFDTEGKECSRASILTDGSILLRSGMTAQGYFISDGTWVPQSDLGAVSSEGVELSLKPSTVGVAVDLSEVTAEQALSLSVSNTYLLESEEIPTRLKSALDQGQIFSFPFNAREDYNVEVGLLVGNDSGYFALIGDWISYEFCSLENVASVIDESADSVTDDLDFEMF